MTEGTLEGISQHYKQQKWIENLEDDMREIIPFVKNPHVTDIAVGNKGQLIVEGIGMDKCFTGTYFDTDTIKRIISQSAAILGVPIDQRNPYVEGVIPLGGYRIRFEGIMPPRAAEGPVFFLRRPSEKIFAFESYLKENRISQERYDLILEHIKRRSNIVIGGSTGSGKTTLLNALIDEMRKITPDERFYIVEDAGEIQCNAEDKVNIWAEGEDTLKAVGAALRCNVSRIFFGELRYGPVTNELLKAMNTGHTGCATTIHANSALSMISRIRALLREVITGELPDISESIQLLIHIQGSKNGPMIDEVVETSQLDNSSFLEELESNGLI